MADAPHPPAPPPARKSTAQVVAETIGDAIAMCIVGALAYTGKVEGGWALGLIGMLAGVRLTDVLGVRIGGGNGNGNGGGRRTDASDPGPPAGGAVGLLVALGGAALSALRAWAQLHHLLG